MIKKLYSLLTKKDKQYLLFLLIFSLFISIIETFGVGVIMPFINVATDFNKIFEISYLKDIYEFFHFKTPFEFAISFGVFLVFFYIFRAIVSFLYFYFLNRFSQSRYYILAYRLFENYMGLEYKEFINRNSAVFIKTIINEANHLVELIKNVLFMSSEIFVAFFLYAFLIYVNWKMTLLLTMFLAINIFILKFTVTKTIKKAGEVREKKQKEFFKILNATFGNFKMIKLKGNEDKILNEFQKSTIEYAKANIKNATFGQIPRLFLEAIGFSLLAIIIIYLLLKAHHDIRNAMPILMAFVLGLYRLMPSVNRIFTAYNSITFHLRSLDIIHNDLIYEKEELGDEEIDFNKEIKLKNVGFEYVENKPVLKDINLTIKKGEKIGIVGESGSGKSTLIDIIIGLYKPKEGKILIDEIELNEKNMKSWRKKVGYIPQMIYLFDGSVAENVAFGEEIDEEKIKEALKKANILEFLEKHHEGIYTKVGEGGVKLSGGQRQRIAIARAIYNNPEILVLDEATSALDSETEKKIMDELYKIGENKTMIIIAHRISTLDGCNRIIKIEHGRIV